MPLDGAEQLVGVADGGDDLLAGVGEDPGEPGPQQHGVLGDHDPHGSSTDTVVGPPFGLMTYMFPPRPATRSRRPWSPEPRAGLGAALAVVAHLDDEPVTGPGDRHVRPGGVGVLGDVRERLVDDEVRRALDGGRRPRGHLDVERDRDRRPGDDRGQRGVEAAVLEDHRVDAAHEVADLAQRRLRLLVGVGDHPPSLRRDRRRASPSPRRAGRPARRAAAAPRRAGRARCAAARSRRCRRLRSAWSRDG